MCLCTIILPGPISVGLQKLQHLRREGAAVVRPREPPSAQRLERQPLHSHGVAVVQRVRADEQPQAVLVRVAVALAHRALVVRGAAVVVARAGGGAGV